MTAPVCIASQLMLSFESIEGHSIENSNSHLSLDSDAHLLEGCVMMVCTVP